MPGVRVRAMMSKGSKAGLCTTTLVALAVAASACGGSSATKSSSAASSGGATRTAPGGAGGAASPSKTGSYGASGAPANGRSSSGAASGLGGTVAAAQPDIVRTASVNLTLPKASKISSSFTKIEDLATSDGGFVGNSSLGQKAASLVLRVPSAKMDGVIAQLHHMGRVPHQSISGQNVTGQVVSTDVNIQNLTSEENAVRGLLSKATTVAQVMQVQGQLFNLQDQVNQLKAQSKSLAEQVTYATITVNLALPAPPPLQAPKPHKQGVFTKAGHAVTTSFSAVARSVVLVLAWGSPLIALALIAGAVWLVVRRRKRMAAPPTAPQG